jgi:hypothetical protein
MIFHLLLLTVTDFRFLKMQKAKPLSLKGGLPYMTEIHN